MSQSSYNQRLIVAMTGASGAAYGLRLIERLGQAGVEQHLLISDAARVVLKQEMDIVLPDAAQDVAGYLADRLEIAAVGLKSYALNDWFSPAASGSSGIHAMAIVPCSMGTMARIATGASDNLIERAADVMLKERGRLVLMPRETPLSSIHLEHMLKLSNLGVHIIPAMPGFYHRPQRIEELVDFMVDRVLVHLRLEPEGMQRWGV
ncbi:MAG: aromatic acid decarboxylase [Zetaproteobacteria bacterium CG12_big_fil_rev_8_21_14_0_65_55_1124]|nr:MAG: aromatic acid decarboxylase [Zetaproteobacteria bacterium CG1_02_55_237]PIS20165.1 MAG: aromatic acid decarboxylase [Zetaproteobacteria bacterium CG08_land_8_20_14_0_20_55_17]PIW42712.1 MAG: aromatic acid decarboxylase [Zetaproteobacteria bacterium CG12_big_fil_rev_8_21_14_0_65_55_1124]PIY53726.1 MAG: aromatic acid decarboxylase [Zetaproteobacteria bacterium CG_4_10_14_0_8_um_filter_55_43]PIZ38812.1 MAG: aromatic acid decarboxylase [Zetaproteobacteria bacterium CG_4_10_14_0_2_um_filter_